MRILFLLHASSLFYEPLGLMYLASVLRRAGHAYDTCRIDASSDLVSKIGDTRADLVAVSTTTGMHSVFLKACERLKQHLDIPVVFGGPHPTFSPEVLNEKSVDFICRGEGESPFLELVEALQKGDDTSHIENIDTKRNGKEVRNSLRPFTKDLDALPFPDRELIKRHGLFRKKWKSFVSGRGCPYRCSYCFNHSMLEMAKGKYVRKRSVDNLIEEVVEVKEKYGIKMVDFLDDVFIMHENWLEEFAEKFPRQVGLPFGCNVRADLVNERNPKLLRKAGCIEVAMGVESGNDRLRNELLERGLTKEQIVGAAKRIRKQGIRLVTQNMIALPEETVENALETVELNLKCSPDFSGFSFYQPYPGTRLCDYAVKKGLFDGQIDHLALFFSQKVGPCAEEKELKEFFKIVRLYPLIYLFPFLYSLLKFSMVGKGGKVLRRHAFRLLVLINLAKQVTALPRGFLYFAWLAITRERTRYHYYKWFSRRLAFLWSRILRTDTIP